MNEPSTDLPSAHKSSDALCTGTFAIMHCGLAGIFQQPSHEITTHNCRHVKLHFRNTFFVQNCQTAKALIIIIASVKFHFVRYSSVAYQRALWRERTARNMDCYLITIFRPFHSIKRDKLFALTFQQPPATHAWIKLMTTSFLDSARRT